MIYLQSQHYDTTHYQYNLPMIGWESYMGLADFSVSTLDADHPPSNLWSPDTYTYWRNGVADGALYLLNPSGYAFNYIALAGHNLYTGNIAVKVSIANSISGPWTDLTSYLSIYDDGPLIFALNPGNTHQGVTYSNNNFTHVRLSFQEYAGYRAQIAHIKMGRLMRLPYKTFVGNKPALLATQVVSEVQVSENGNYLGRINRAASRELEINSQHNSQGFVWNDVRDFLQHCQGIARNNGTPQETFFYVPRPADAPDGGAANFHVTDMIYGWAKSINWPSNEAPNGLMSWGLSIKGIA